MTPSCGKCTYCLDMPHFGGPGYKKKACIHRKCQYKVSIKCMISLAIEIASYLTGYKNQKCQLTAIT